MLAPVDNLKSHLKAGFSSGGLSEGPWFGVWTKFQKFQHIAELHIWRKKGTSKLLNPLL
jgi:hypothetical protein